MDSGPRFLDPEMDAELQAFAELMPHCRALGLPHLFLPYPTFVFSFSPSLSFYSNLSYLSLGSPPGQPFRAL